MIITEQLVRKLLDTVDAGLTAGVGVPEPGKMCVEAAISFALGEPHSDGPSCVGLAVRAGKIALNDCTWSSDLARANGMRRVAIAQLGSKGVDQAKYVRLLAQYTIDGIVPLAAKSAEFAAKSAAKSAAKYAKYAAKSAESAEYAAEYAESAKYAAASAAEYAAEYAAKYAEYAKYAKYAAKSAAEYAEYAAKYAAKSAKYAEYAAKYAEQDIALRLSAELMVRALQECGSPGCDWLWLCDEIKVTI